MSRSYNSINPERELVFIASGGRTATNLFGDHLGEVIEDCWSEHEPDLFAGLSRLTARRIKDFGLLHMTVGKRRGLRELAIAHRKGAPKESTIEALRKLRRKYHCRRESLIVESYSQWWMFADILNDVYPNARMVGVVRNPFDWVSSWLSHKPSRRSWMELFSRSIRAENWSELNQIERLAWEWNEIASFLLQNQGPTIQVYRFEDLLFEEDCATLERMVSFVANGRNFTNVGRLRATKVNASAPKTRNSVDPDAVRVIEQHCGATMHRLGYASLKVTPDLAV